MTRIAPVLALALTVIACEDRRDLGQSGLDWPVFGDPDAAVTRDCSTFRPPTGDCTIAGTQCISDLGCEAGEGCNAYHDRCYPESASCVGTQCVFDGDCGTGARCNQTAGLCFDPAESQECMGCISLSDCGPGDCNIDTGRCTAP